MTDLSKIEVLTVSEVNCRVPLLSRIMADLRGIWKRRADVRKRLRMFRRVLAQQSSPEVMETVQNLENLDRQLDDEMTSLEEEVQQLGGIVKDPGNGVVNFFSDRDGSLVFLSWMLGESEVRYWHDLDAGLKQRRELSESPDLSPASE